MSEPKKQKIQDMVGCSKTHSQTQQKLKGIGDQLSTLNRPTLPAGRLREFFDLFLADPDIIGASRRVIPEGLEPSTNALRGHCSTIELWDQFYYFTECACAEQACL